MSSKPIKVDSDHHQRADGHVVAVGNTAATQASQGTVAAVVTTAIMVWSLVLVVLEVRANRRGASRSRTQPVKRPPHRSGGPGPPRKQAGRAVSSSSGPWALTAGASRL
jgi:hypothetical protein